MNSDERLGEDDEGMSAAPRGPGRPRKNTAEQLAGDRERVERGHEERDITENREMTEDERFEIFLGQRNSILPDIPNLPGYHVCWATTSNSHDSIQHRLQIGYELIRIDMVPGWDGVSLKTGDYGGCIGINEMVAMRIPLRLFNRMMHHVHHKLPMEDELKLKAKVELMKDQAAEMGGYVQEGDGMSALAERVAPMPAFQY